MKRTGLEHLTTTGKLEGKKGRGRQREKHIDGLRRWLGAELVTEVIHRVWDQERWKAMIVKACGCET